MRVTRILNHVEKHKSFVYGSAKFVKREGNKILKVPIRPRKNARPVCSRCGRCGPVHDRSKEARWFAFVRPANADLVRSRCRLATDRETL